MLKSYGWVSDFSDSPFGLGLGTWTRACQLCDKKLCEKLKTVNPQGGGYKYGLRPLNKKFSKSALNG